MSYHPPRSSTNGGREPADYRKTLLAIIITSIGVNRGHHVSSGVYSMIQWSRTPRFDSEPKFSWTIWVSFCRAGKMAV